MREYMEQYLKQFETSHDIYIKGQEAERVHFTIVNIFPLINEDVISEAMTIAAKLQTYQTEFDKKLGSIKSI